MTQISWVLSTMLKTLQSPFGNGMETVHAHIAAKPNIATMDFQQKIKVSNPLQHKEPNLPKMHVVKDLICDKAIGCQKSM